MDNIFKNAKAIGSGVNPSDYHGAENAPRGDKARVMGRSDLMEFARCPSRWLAGYEGVDTKSTAWGNLLDTMALAPEDLDERYALTPDTYPDSKTREAKPWNWNANHCIAWRAQQGSKSCIRPKELAEGNAALAKLKACDAFGRLLDGAKTQVHVTGEYHDRATGLIIPVKILIDIQPDAGNKDFRNCLADFKTCFTADGKRWARVAHDRGYHIQAAFYLDLFNAATEEERTDWLLVVQENFAPYEVASPIPLLSQEFVNLGRLQYRQALRDYCQCLESNRWPSYAPTQLVIDPFQIIEPEPWMVGVSNAMRTIAPEPTKPEIESDQNDFTP